MSGDLLTQSPEPFPTRLAYTPIEFAEKLRALRGENTQQDLADMIGCGCSVRTLQAWESCRATPNELFCRLIVSHVQARMENFETVQSRRFRTWRDWLDACADQAERNVAWAAEQSTEVSRD